MCTLFILNITRLSIGSVNAGYGDPGGHTVEDVGLWQFACWGLRVRIPPVGMDVCCDCCVLSGSGLCVGLITRPEESYRLWCVVMCDLETSWMRRPWPTGSWCARNKQNYTRCQFLYLTQGSSVDLDQRCWVINSRLLSVIMPLLRFLRRGYEHCHLVGCDAYCYRNFRFKSWYVPAFRFEPWTVCI